MKEEPDRKAQESNFQSKRYLSQSSIVLANFQTFPPFPFPAVVGKRGKWEKGGKRCSISVATDAKIRIGRRDWRSRNGRGSNDNGKRLSKLPIGL